MIKEIKYSGYSATPSDYDSPDGELATAVNVIPEDGAIKPVLPPTTILQLGKGKKVPFIHQTVNFTHYIIQDDTTEGQHAFYYIDRADSSQKLVPITTTAGTTTAYTTSDKILLLSAIGNVLIIFTNTGMNYFFWKDGTAYKYLGTHIPELRLQFAMQYEVVQSDEFHVDYQGHLLMRDSSKYGSAFCNKWSDDKDYSTANQDGITQRVLGQANKFIAEKVNKKGRFLYPFFVRYAYRLYDGTYTMPSAPILMYCADGCTPLPVVTNSEYEGNKDSHGYYKGWYCKIVAPVFDLYYQAQYADKTKLADWADIITSVDIFVSQPIYTYDQNGKIESNVPCTEKDFNWIGKNVGESAYTKHSAIDMVNKIASDKGELNAKIAYKMLTPLPEKSKDTITSDIKDNANFYLLKSYKIDELSTALKKIDVKEDYLQSLVNRERLTDDYDSHDTLIPSRSFTYNSRLNLTGITKIPFGGFDACSLGEYVTTSKYVIKDIYVYIKQDGHDVIVKTDGKYNFNSDILYFYYPNANAYKAVVTTNEGANLVYDLSKHPFLNGAFWFGDFDLPTNTGSVPEVTKDPKIILNNKIYMSDVNNPFHFPTLGIYTVGAGTILGVSTAAKALSQGQFGQFPLYAFTTEGVWALEVNTSTGSYSARQPITRDICINPESITQIDTAVLFVTDRGIMLISGSTSICISDILNSKDVFNPLNMPDGDKLATLAQLTTKNVRTVPFMEFLKECRMLYDYPHQRIIVYNPDYSYAYVYSLKDKKWGMIPSTIDEGVNFYPEVLAMDTDGNLLRYSVDEGDASAGTRTSSSSEGIKGVHGIIFTRPLKLDMPDVLKTVDTIIQRGYFKRNHVAQVLYGSRDLFNWHVVWSSTDKYLRGFGGTPYKYFRIAMVCNLDPAETLSGCTVQFTPRLQNQPR